MVDKLTSIKGALTAKNRGTEEGSESPKKNWDGDQQQTAMDKNSRP